MSRNQDLSLHWQDLENPPAQSGWFLVSIMPINWREIGIEGVHSWMAKFGLHEGWYNDSTKRWFTYSPGWGPGMEDATSRILQWCVKPLAPLPLVLPDRPLPRWRNTRGQHNPCPTCGETSAPADTTNS